MELKATRPAVYSGSPFAKSLQTNTIAIHLASPIMINPIIYSGISLRKSMANKNIRIGPITQFCTNDSSRTFQSLNTRPSFSYFTFASGGYIMTIRPMAMGTEVVPTCILDNTSEKFGTKYPKPIPIAMAPKIQNVR
ncbi:hypothetical protein D3C78_920140 [compost metagenome]